MNYIMFKSKLCDEMKSHHMEVCDLLPIDWHHLYKHCSVSYIISKLTWRAVRDRCFLKQE